MSIKFKINILILLITVIENFIMNQIIKSSYIPEITMLIIFCIYKINTKSYSIKSLFFILIIGDIINFNTFGILLFTNFSSIIFIKLIKYVKFNSHQKQKNILLKWLELLIILLIVSIIKHCVFYVINSKFTLYFKYIITKFFITTIIFPIIYHYKKNIYV